MHFRNSQIPANREAAGVLQKRTFPPRHDASHREALSERPTIHPMVKVNARVSGRIWTFEQYTSAFFRPLRATESDELPDEGEFQGCTLVHRRFLNMVDNDDFDRTFARLQLEPELPLHSLENCGSFRRHALIHIEIKIEIK
jgi:hypothetical protein